MARSPVFHEPRSWRPVIVGLLAFIPIGGCSRRGGMPTAYPVTGTVMVDSEPLNEGAITFDPADGKGGVYGGPISSGRYDVKVAEGPKKVSILGMKHLGAIGPDGKPMASQFLPQQYTDGSELTATIEPRRNEVSFELSTKK
jgi:hypothetical protein